MTNGLKELFKLKRHHYGTLDEFDKKLSIIQKELEMLQIFLKYVSFQEIDDDFFSYEVVDKQYVSNRSELLISDEEYCLIKSFIKENG